MNKKEKSKQRAPERHRLALDAYVKLLRCVGTLLAAVRLQAPLPSRLTLSQFEVLEALLHRGALCQRQISQKILKTTGNITMVIDHLEQNGLVERGRDPSDRRISRVRLTPRGRKAIASYFPIHAQAIADKMAVLSSTEQKTLAELCKRLGLGIRNQVHRDGGEK